MAKGIWKWAVIAMFSASFSSIIGHGEDRGIRFRIAEENRIIVPVYVNGHGLYDFLLDTGAPISYLDEKICRKLGLQVAARILDNTFTGAVWIPLAGLESITVGSESLIHLSVLCYDLKKLWPLGSKIQGILGQNFLSKFNYLIDYRQQVLIFEKDGDLVSRLTGERVPVVKNQEKFYVTLHSSGSASKCRQFLLDSGCVEPLIFVSPDEVAELGIEQIVGRVRVGQTALGRRTMKSCRMQLLQVGPVVFANVPVMLADLLPGEERYGDGVLPTSLFDAVYFNSRENYVILNPKMGQEEPSAPPG